MVSSLLYIWINDINEMKCIYSHTNKHISVVSDIPPIQTIINEVCLYPIALYCVNAPKNANEKEYIVLCTETPRFVDPSYYFPIEKVSFVQSYTIKSRRNSLVDESSMISSPYHLGESCRSILESHMKLCVSMGIYIDYANYGPGESECQYCISNISLFKCFCDIVVSRYLLHQVSKQSGVKIIYDDKPGYKLGNVNKFNSYIKLEANPGVLSKIDRTVKDVKYLDNKSTPGHVYSIKSDVDPFKLYTLLSSICFTE